MRVGEFGRSIDFKMRGQEARARESLDHRDVVQRIELVLLTRGAAIGGDEDDDEARVACLGDRGVEQRRVGDERRQGGRFSGDDESGRGVVEVRDGQAIHPCLNRRGRCGGRRIGLDGGSRCVRRR